MSSWLAIIRTVNQLSLHNLAYSVVDLLITGLPLLESYFTSSSPSLNFLCHSKTRECDMLISPYICWSISRVCDGVFPNWTKNFRFNHCLVFIVRSSFWRCPWCSRYRRRKWTRRHEFKSWTRLIAFHIALIPLGKVWIQLFSLQLWVNSRTD